MILIEGLTYFTVIHHFLHFTFERLIIYLVLQKWIELLLIHEFLGLCHLFHHLDQGSAEVELPSRTSSLLVNLHLVWICWMGFIGIGVVITTVRWIVIVHIRHTYICPLCICCCHLQFSGFKDALLPYAMRHVDRQKMISELIELFYTFYMSAHDSLLFLENTDITIDLDVRKLFIVKISEGGWNLIFALMIEQNIKGASIIVELELCSHGLFNPP